MQLTGLTLVFAAIAPAALAGSLATREAEISPECQALVDAQAPVTKSYFRILCASCYDKAQMTCSATDGTPCIETTLQDWTQEARTYGEGLCSEYKTASSALFCTSNKIREWIGAGNCKA